MSSLQSNSIATVIRESKDNSKIESLPDTQQELFSLRRDVGCGEIYQLLLYKAQEMEWRE